MEMSNYYDKVRALSFNDEKLGIARDALTVVD